jgi:hypothetical protein
MTMWGSKTVSANEMMGEKKESGRNGYILGQMNHSMNAIELCAPRRLLREATGWRSFASAEGYLLVE